MDQKLVTVYGLEFEGKIVYVGSTTYELNKRAREHQYMARKSNLPNKLHVWIREKNPDFKIIRLDQCSSETRYYVETFYMKKHDTIQNGFNSEEAHHSGRPKGCKNPTGADHYMFGKKMPEHIKEAARQYHLGRKLSEDHKRKLHAAGRAASLKKILRSDGAIFDSMSEAAASVGVTISAVSVAVKRSSNCKGYQFEFVNKPASS